jgi:hypothetical protein
LFNYFSLILCGPVISFRETNINFKYKFISTLYVSLHTCNKHSLRHKQIKSCYISISISIPKSMNIQQVAEGKKAACIFLCNIYTVSLSFFFFFFLYIYIASQQSTIIFLCNIHTIWDRNIAAFNARGCVCYKCED